MQNRTATLILAGLAYGVLGTAAPAAAQAASQDETFRLIQVAGKALPAVIEEEDGCREEVVSGTLTLKADGIWILVTQEREVCGDRVEEEDEREEGKYSIEGSLIRFVDDDCDGDADEDDTDDDLDLDDMTTGTRTAEGLTVRLKGSDAVLVFRR